MLKGQYYRLFIRTSTIADYVAIAAAKELTLHVSAQVEDGSTKDTTDEWTEQDVTGLSYDISSNSLVLSEDDTLTTKPLNDLELIFEGGNKVYWEIARASGTNNREIGDILCSGSAYISQLQVNAANRQNATIAMTLQGYGEMVLSTDET